MEPIRTLQEVEKLVKEKVSPKMVVAYGQDPDTLKACHRAVKEDIAKVMLVGDRKVIERECGNLNVSPDMFEIVHEPDEKKSGTLSVQMIAEKKAQILMKGLISTPYFLKAILNKELNLLPKKACISHTTLMEIPGYKKLLMISDVAMIPQPDLDQKIQMINYNIKMAGRLGIREPRIAIISANEKVSVKMPSTVDAAILSKMSDRGQIKGAVIDGPLAFDVAVSPKACEIKRLKSPVEGYADILIFPEIVSGNVFFKSATIFCGAVLAGVLTGIPFPTVLVSRADTDDSKYYSIVLASLMV